jgi:hypothetical protein
MITKKDNTELPFSLIENFNDSFSGKRLVTAYNAFVSLIIVSLSIVKSIDNKF